MNQKENKTENQEEIETPTAVECIIVDDYEECDLNSGDNPVEGDQVGDWVQ